MRPLTLTAVESAIRANWALDTCDEVDVTDWSPGNPARGQCGATTLVLHDLFGGLIATAEVWDGDRQQGHHSWLRTPGGMDLDLTREQFSATEMVSAPGCTNARAAGRAGASNSMSGSIDASFSLSA